MQLFRAILNRMFPMLPSRVLDVAVQVLNRSLGRGGGGGTTTEEVHFIFGFLRPLQDHAYVVFDVGANVGEYTDTWISSDESVQVVAFEPSVTAFAELQKRFFSEPRVNLQNLACSSVAGRTTLFSDSPGSGLASLSKRRLEHFGTTFTYQEEVQTVSLDDWCVENDTYPDVLKLDVEGHELEILRGATECLKHCQVVQFEFGGCNIDSRTFFQDFWYFFRDLGFNLFRMSPKGLIPITQYSEFDEVFSATNYLAVRLTQ